MMVEFSVVNGTFVILLTFPLFIHFVGKRKSVTRRQLSASWESKIHVKGVQRYHWGVNRIANH